MENVCPSADASLEQLASLLAAHEERMRRREKERRILAASLATRTACFASMRDDCAAEALAVEDSVVGATSAVAAGLVVVAVPSVPDGDPVPAHHRVVSLTDPAFRSLVARWLG